jgi:hypothetical protein
MTLPNLKPTANTSQSERHHLDPPGLWATVILSSLVIHLFVFGMLRLWLTLRLNNVLTTQNFIPIDVIAVASEAKTPTQPLQNNASSAIQNPSVANNPAKTPNQSPRSQTSSTSVRTNSPQTGTQQGVKREGTSTTGKQSPPAQTIPTVKQSPTTNPSQNPPPETPAQKPSPVTNPAQNKPSETQSPSTKPNSPTNPGNQPNGSTTSPSPNPNSSSGSGEGQNSTTPQPGGIFISSTSQPDLLSNDNEVLHPNDPNSGDALATIERGSTQLSGDELKQLGIIVEREFEMKVAVLIDEQGNASLLDVIFQGLPENLSVEGAKQLASKSIAKLKFKPTKMSGGAVPRDYTLTLRIRPNQK